MAEDASSIAKEITKLKKSRGNAKGAISKATSKIVPMEGWNTRDIDYMTMDSMMKAARKSGQTMEELRDKLIELDPANEREHEGDLIKAQLAVDVLLEDLATKSQKGHACYELEGILAYLAAFRMTEESDPQQVTNQILRKGEEFTRVQGTYRRAIRSDECLQGLAEAVQAKLADLNSKLPEIERPTDVGVRSDRSDRPPDRESRSYHHRKLPTIEIPHFTGDILEWNEFWAIFKRTVHTNKELENDEKRAYLQQAIRDKSQANLVDSLAGDYGECVASLKARYEQPRLIHQHYVKVFFSCKPCKDDSKQELTRIHATFSQAKRKITETRKTELDEVMESFAESVLPPITWRKWSETHRDQHTIPKLSELLEFVEFQANLAGRAGPDQATPRRDRERPSERPADRPRYDRRPPIKDERPTREVFATTTTNHPCLRCQETTHSLYSCPTFLEQTPEQRNEFVTSARLCYNCLCPNHDKGACKSTYTCRRCNKQHHTLLHLERPPHRVEITGPAPTQGKVNVVNIQTTSPSEANGTSTIHIEEALSPTLSLTAQSPTGREAAVTALFDPGATLSLITKRVVNQLGLTRRRCNVNIVQALGSELANATAVTLTVTSRHVPGEFRELVAVVVPRIGGVEDDQPISGDWEFLAKLRLANPDFRERRKIDIILGQNVIRQVIRKGQCEGQEDSFWAQETIWGWMVQGRVGRSQRLPTKETTATRSQCHSITSIAMNKLQADLDGNQILETFFGAEALDKDEKTPSMEDQEALEHFSRTHQILPDGRFQVSLPRKQHHQELGPSRGAALRRYLSNEKSLIRRKALQPFQRVMEEYFDLDHAEVIPPAELQVPTPEQYYMPLHAVVKATSTTTKLRIVFDASANTASGVSLNDNLLIGPTVHPPLTDILLRFRQHRIGMTSDISKMYREISLEPHDRDLHRFLWRQKPTDAITDCRMKRVTFGVASSPFMATQVLQQVAANTKEECPETAAAISSQFYVDDFISGAETALQALSIQKQVQKTLGNHHLTLRKWRSSSSEVLKGIPSALHETETESEPYGRQSYQKTLGVKWDAKRDRFYVSISELELPSTITKRALTSDVARTFDIMGWFAPATLSMKALIQQLWAAGIGWDEEVPDKIQQEWTQWRKELPQLAEQPIPRSYYLYDRGCRGEVYLHGFSDASIRGYAAVIYLRTIYHQGPPTVALLQAKTKVAPLKGLTVPRLELCGAQLLSSLITTVRTALGIPLDRIQCWTDSQITIYWLDGKSRPHRTFVSNRVRRTLEKVPPQYWLHVPGVDNPADCASRGITPGALRTHGLWWHGPAWLSQEPIVQPPQPQLAHLDKSQEELVKQKVIAVVGTSVQQIEERYSTLQQLLRTVAWCLRFVRNTTTDPGDRPKSKSLSVTDITAAEIRLYERAQKRMIAGRKVTLWEKDRIIRSLNPTKDKDGLYRVNGRLQQSPLSYDQRCPIILEGADILTRLIISQHHVQGEHAGPTLLMSMVGRKHYVIRGLTTVKAIVRNCVTCKRTRMITEQQQMGQLPPSRVTPSRPFSQVGTDFAGPFTLKQGHTRKPVHIKAYVCVFICMATKATHLEVVSSLSSEAFLDSLTRFVSRRGLPACIYSDNGSNYVGASRELEDIYQLMREEETQQTIMTYCVNQRITWKFNPARAPHFGGLWEAAVKAFKLHFWRIVKTTTLTYEDITTLLCRIEAALNSRPLMPLHTHSSEGIDVLTPGHFLIGQPLNSLPEIEINPERHPRSHFVHCQQLAQRFWSRWSTDYLHQLHKRTKWHKKTQDVAVGDIALIRGESTYHTNTWPMAKVIQTYQGKDGLVRAVDLQAGGRIYRRPIAKLTILVRSSPEVDTEGIGSRTIDVPLPPAGMSESRDSDKE